MTPKQQRWAIGLGVPVVAGAIAFVLYPKHGIRLRHESTWNVLINNPILLDGLRTVVVVAGIFVVLSMIMRALRGDWLSVFGPLSVGKAKSEIAATDEQMRRLRQERDDAVKAAADVVTELDDSKRAAAAYRRLLQSFGQTLVMENALPTTPDEGGDS